MLTADTGAHAWTNLTSVLYCHLDQLTYTILVEYLEGVNLQDLLLEVCRQEACDVVTRIAEGHLCEVVGSE